MGLWWRIKVSDFVGGGGEEGRERVDCQLDVGYGGIEEAVGW
jgi:hypothetical protein